MFNDEQKDHMKALADNPMNVCGCGWYTKEDCWTLCPNKASQRVEEARVSKLVARIREDCAKIVDEECRTHYDLINSSDNNSGQRGKRYVLNLVARKIRGLPYSHGYDVYQVPPK